MSYNLKDIVYEDGEYWVLKVHKGFEVYKTGVCYSKRVSQIGYTGAVGIECAVNEIERRKATMTK
jgi:hypothetical protein